MKPNGGGAPTGALMSAIQRDFGSFEEFVTQFKAAGATQVGRDCCCSGRRGGGLLEAGGLQM